MAQKDHEKKMLKKSEPEAPNPAKNGQAGMWSPEGGLDKIKKNKESTLTRCDPTSGKGGSVDPAPASAPPGAKPSSSTAPEASTLF